MKQTITFLALTILILASCKESRTNKSIVDTKTDSMAFKSGYSDVNGLKMYYEIYGEGKPLVLIHGGGSTIETTFGTILPLLARFGKVIARCTINGRC